MTSVLETIAALATEIRLAAAGWPEMMREQVAAEIAEILKQPASRLIDVNVMSAIEGAKRCLTIMRPQLKQVRLDGIEEVARRYHGAIAATMRTTARDDRRIGYHGAADDHLAIAARHEQYAKDIRARVWEKESEGTWP